MDQMCSNCGKETTFVMMEEDYYNEVMNEVYECCHCGKIDYVEEDDEV